MQWDFVIALALVTFLSVFQPRLRRTAITIAGCWLAQTGFVVLTGIYDPWHWFALTNLAAAVAVLWHPAYKMQSMIGSVLMVQAIIDSGYGLAGNQDAMMGYLVTQTNIGWFILALLGFWNVGTGVRYWRRIYNPVANPSSSKSMG